MQGRSSLYYDVSTPPPPLYPLFYDAQPWRGGIIWIIVKDNVLVKNPSKNIVWK